MRTIVKNGAALILVLALLAGCGNKEKQVVGHYSAKATATSGKAEDPATKAGLKIFSSLKLELKADKSFTISGPFPAVNGTWTYADGKVTMTSPSGGPKPQVMDVTADGTLKPEEPAPGFEVVFVKESS